MANIKRYKENYCYNCNRELMRQTANVIFFKTLNDFADVCKYCLIDDPKLGRL